MPFNCLLLSSLVSAHKTSVTEQGITVDFPRVDKGGDVILIFKTDNEEYRRLYAPGKVSDFVYYFTNENDQQRAIYTRHG